MVLKKLICKCKFSGKYFELSYIENQYMMFDPLKYECCPCCGEQSYSIEKVLEYKSDDVNKEYPKSMQEVIQNKEKLNLVDMVNLQIKGYTFEKIFNVTPDIYLFMRFKDSKFIDYVLVEY